MHLSKQKFKVYNHSIKEHIIIKLYSTKLEILYLSILLLSPNVCEAQQRINRSMNQCSHSVRSFGFSIFVLISVFNELFDEINEIFIWKAQYCKQSKFSHINISSTSFEASLCQLFCSSKCLPSEIYFTEPSSITISLQPPCTSILSIR